MQANFIRFFLLGTRGSLAARFLEKSGPAEGRQRTACNTRVKKREKSLAPTVCSIENVPFYSNEPNQPSLLMKAMSYFFFFLGGGGRQKI